MSRKTALPFALWVSMEKMHLIGMMLAIPGRPCVDGVFKPLIDAWDCRPIPRNR